ncbi:hypothetical protein LEMLEM_LOCUS6201 [Lemmus lemmus]
MGSMAAADICAGTTGSPLSHPVKLEKRTSKPASTVTHFLQTTPTLTRPDFQ